MCHARACCFCWSSEYGVYVGVSIYTTVYIDIYALGVGLLDVRDVAPRRRISTGKKRESCINKYILCPAAPFFIYLLIYFSLSS